MSLLKKYSNKTKIQNHKVVNSKLGIININILAFILFAIIRKPMKIGTIKWVFERALTIYTEAMNNGKFYFKPYTEIEIEIILLHVYHTWDKSPSPSIYVLC